jgi:hypothetical protein
MKNTNWSSPKRNIIAGMLDLRSALASGYKAKLVRAFNEECEHPIKEKLQDTDFRNYKFSIGYASSVNKIKEDPNRSDFEKQLSLNYVSCYGDPDAVKSYYETGILTKRNVRSMGVNHLVKVDDLIAFFKSINDSRANIYEKQYRAPEHVDDTSHFFDFFSYKHGSQYAIKKFKRKLWVVQLDGKAEKAEIPAVIKVLNFLMRPLKYVPSRSVFCMKEYKLITYRVGGVTNGFKVEFQIPRKFDFK